MTVTEVTAVIEAGASTEEAVGDACGAGTGCGSCLERICEMLGSRYPLHGRAALRATG